MNVKAVISVVLFAVIALCLTFWLGGSGAPSTKGAGKRYDSYGDDRDAPPLDEDDRRPKAVITEDAYDFGVMELGEKLQHTFTLKNEGEDKLVIAKGASTCKCTVSNLPTNEIPPGESAEINLEWEPKSLSPMFFQSARIWTNDPKKRAIDLRVEGVVTSAVDLLPGTELDAGNVQEEVGAKTRLFLYSQVAEEMSPPEVSYAGKWLSFETEPGTEEDLSSANAKSGYKIIVNVSPEVPVGAHREVFEVKTTARGKENVREVSIVYDRKGPVTIIPMPGTLYEEEAGMVDFERFPAEKGKKQTITIMIDDPKDSQPIELTVEENHFPEMTIMIEPNKQLVLNKRQAFNVTFSVPPGLPPINRTRETSSKVLLKTNHALVKEIKLRVDLQSY